MSYMLSEEISNQIETLELDPDRPLVISDADEVLLQFMRQFEIYLDRNDMWIDLSSFRLQGNIKYKGSDEAVDMTNRNIIDDFFAAETLNFSPVEGAAEALNALSKEAQVIILTNLPLAQKSERQINLSKHGMDYPVIVGSGLKGPAVKSLGEKINAPLFFLDDIPHNINSVAEYVPTSGRIHMIADPRLSKLIGAAEGASARIDQWQEAQAWILDKLTG
ncbi:Glycerol-3-phosphate acyltransferase Acyl-PO4 G3P acyltransferase Acyl-phosphate--glycerol-3 protein [Candidatus Micropelagos thuwalensis]|uniref:Glycerol-3-phosphate acyltransferase Acyl-PO4 G3P acyltransferase Acyl-phosphate--glycerol-3 protein n=1 Tax=Candidatus Micropelagius thuwalensis TaxID=1397666 RepID=U2WUM8_9PROT|nr:hypothetical protein [Candidatus Micropelagos thuwalensis]ERL47233.1 Glycerol-3-phosphate acyltransferase Acyl-PO4 G3P acyltransferase Acyl-phosphate--glycerol-3 protein [Candidatus Micropelagos thuwalensis]